MFVAGTRRVAAGAGIALLVAVGAGACGGGDGGGSGVGIDKAAFTQKLKSEPQLKNASDKVIGCLRDTAIKYGDAGRIADYIKGDKDFSKIVSKDKDDDADTSYQKCIK